MKLLPLLLLFSIAKAQKAKAVKIQQNAAEALSIKELDTYDTNGNNESNTVSNR